MNIFVDVDYTILGLDNSLRPGVRETLQKLKDGGHGIYIWSGMGKRWEVVEKYDLTSLVNGVYEKPTHHFHERLNELGIPFEPDFVVDDYPEIVDAFGGVCVPPYLVKRNSDNEMDRVYRIVCDVVRDGTSMDEQYRPKGASRRIF
jgi:hypothetical protein